MTFKNFTPHTISICSETGDILRTFPSDGIARASSTTELVDTIDGLRITRSVFGIPENLPDYTDDVFLIVSFATAEAARRAGRRLDDLLLTNETVRDASGRIIGCRSLAMVD